LPISATRSPVWTRMPARSMLCAAANPDFRTRARHAGRHQRQGQADRLHYGPDHAGLRSRRRVYRGRYTVASRQWSRRSQLCLCCRPRDRGCADRLHRGRYQIDRAGRNRRRGRAADPRSQSAGGCGGCFQSGGRRDPRLQIPRSDRGRHLGRTRPQGSRRHLHPLSLNQAPRRGALRN
jgi:hypothetical protein